MEVWQRRGRCRRPPPPRAATSGGTPPTASVAPGRAVPAWSAVPRGGRRRVVGDSADTIRRPRVQEPRERRRRRSPAQHRRGGGGGQARLTRDGAAATAAAATGAAATAITTASAEQKGGAGVRRAVAQDLACGEGRRAEADAAEGEEDVVVPHRAEVLDLRG